jgi:hypothetical protein
VNEPTLHPNLARIAAQYDDVLRRFSLRQIDNAAAQAEISALQARDDEGVIWRLDPKDASWLRKARDGSWIKGEPPRSGLATPTAHDLSRDPRVFNPDSRIRFEEAPQGEPGFGLQGTTRSLTGTSPAADGGGAMSRTAKQVAAGVAGLALAVAALLLFTGNDEPVEVPAGEPVEEPDDELPAPGGLLGG